MDVVLTFLLCTPGGGRFDEPRPIYGKYAEYAELIDADQRATLSSILSNTRRLRGCPKVAALRLFPCASATADAIKRNRDYRDHVGIRLGLEDWRWEEWWDLWERNEWLYARWDLLSDCHDAAARFSVSWQRTRLEKVRKIIGEADFQRGRMPAATALEE